MGPIPVERPPDEVMASIFREAADYPLAFNELHCALAISRVNSRWRTIALSDPALWTTICVSGRRSLNTAAVFLRRSTPLLFRLSVSTQCRQQPSNASRILEVISPHLDRCSSLALRLTDDELSGWAAQLLNQGPHSLQRLHRLSLDVHSYAPDELWGPPDSIAHFTALCRNIRSLRIAGGPPLRLRLHDHLTWSHLTTLNVRCTWDGAFVRVVCAHAHALRALVLRDYAPDVFTETSAVCLLTLTELALEFRDRALAEGLLTLGYALDLPRLTRLDIKGPRGGGTSCLHSTHGYAYNGCHRDFDADVGFLNRPFPRLRILSLADVVLTRPLDGHVLHSLCAHISELCLTNVQFPACSETEADVAAILAPYARLRVIEITHSAISSPSISLPATLQDRVSIRVKDASAAERVPGEVGFYIRSNNRTTDFEDKDKEGIGDHLCSDFCELHNESPWADTRTEGDRLVDWHLLQAINRGDAGCRQTGAGVDGDWKCRGSGTSEGW